jgi:hypothetical protein
MTTSSTPLLIAEPNLSTAWARAFLHILDHPGKEVSPLVITIDGFNDGVPLEDEAVRQALDVALLAVGEQEVHTVANTIFPTSVWRLSRGDRQRFYATYIKNVDRYKALAKSKNNRGLYFERLIAFGTDGIPCDGNQLEYIIEAYLARPGVRRSMFQLAIFDPARDHVGTAQMGFPCLHSVSFVPGDGGLALNAFYPTQQVFEKAYGNLLGLARLGGFVAGQMGLEFRRLNCFVGIEKLDEHPKSSPALTDLIAACRVLISQEALAVGAATA